MRTSSLAIAHNASCGAPSNNQICSKQGGCRAANGPASSIHLHDALTIASGPRGASWQWDHFPGRAAELATFSLTCAHLRNRGCSSPLKVESAAGPSHLVTGLRAARRPLEMRSSVKVRIYTFSQLCPGSPDATQSVCVSHQQRMLKVSTWSRIPRSRRMCATDVARSCAT